MKLKETQFQGAVIKRYGFLGLERSSPWNVMKEKFEKSDPEFGLRELG